MKKAILIALLAAATTTFAQDLVNLRMDRRELGLRGNVEALDECNLYRKDYFREDWPQRKWFRSDLRNILQEGDGHVYQFASNGRLKKVTYKHQGKVVASTECSYARNGRLTSFLGEGYKVVAKYEGNTGFIDIYAETRNYGRVGDLEHANLSTSAYKLDYPFAYSCRQDLNDEGMPLRSTYLNVDSTLAREVEYTYSFDGKVAEKRIKSYTGGQKPDEMVCSYTYDGFGNLIARRVTSKAVNETYAYKNNEHGDYTEMTVERAFGTDTYTYDYDYDEQGNWTLRLAFKNGDFEHATLRTITYGKGGKEKVDKDANADAPADGNAYYDEYDATAAHEAAVAAKKDARKSRRNKAIDPKEKQQETSTQQADNKSEKSGDKKMSKREEKKSMEKRAKEMKKEAQMTAREKAKMQKKAERKAAKAAKKAKAKQAKKEAKEARKIAEKKAKEDAKAVKSAANEAQKAAKKQAREDAAAAEKKAKEEAKAEAKLAKEEARKAEKAAKDKAEAERKAMEKSAKEAQKLKEQQAAEQAKAAEKAAKKQAEMEAKASKAAAKAAEKEARKAAKAAEKEARRKANQ